ncbi:MAG TPA: ABC transporter substrate-binding protein [Candidatus Binatia bacterium]|jgi:NitT/TauT family transport system substrate-binding protein|nr:ABC transporter substrate-binding protein [Candidatus Binatia bacterium]
MKKLIFLAICLVFCSFIRAGSAQEKIRIGQGSVSLQSGLMHIAKDRGLFAKYGLVAEVVYVPGGTTNVQVLVSGSLDLSQLSGAPGVAANLEGADLVYFLGLLDKLNYQLITRPEIKGVEQLKGKKFGVSRFGSSADFGMRAMLKRLGVDPVKDATILQIGDEPARIAAIKSGNIDGTVANAPFGNEAERLKLNVVADSVKMDIPFFNTGLLGSKRYLDKQEAKVMNFLRAYLEAIKVLKTEREYSIKALAQFTRVQNLKAIQEGYDYFIKQLEPVPYPSVAAMQAVVDQIAESNAKARGIDAKSYVSDRYLKRLEEEGFVKKIWGK